MAQPFDKNDLHRSQKSLFLQQHWEISSVGSEHYLDKVGVTGSSPVFPTVGPAIIKPGFSLKFTHIRQFGLHQEYIIRQPHRHQEVDVIALHRYRMNIGAI